jgi:hypothetical protein
MFGQKNKVFEAATLGKTALNYDVLAGTCYEAEEENSTAYIHPLGRTVIVNITSASESFKAEFPIQPGATVKQLCRRVADVKDAGWAKLLAGSTVLKEEVLLHSIPENQIVTAIIMNAWDRPDHLRRTLREQICKSLEMNDAKCPVEAFQEPTWDGFRSLCEPIQDFTIFVFGFTGKQIIRFEFRIGGKSYGSLHVAGAVDPIMHYADDNWKPLVEPWTDVPDEEQQSGSCPPWMAGEDENASSIQDSLFFKALMKAEHARTRLAGSW